MLPIYQYIYWLVVGDTRFPPDNSEKHKYNFRKIHLWLIENVSIIDDLLLSYLCVNTDLLLSYQWVIDELLMDIDELLQYYLWSIDKSLLSYC